MNSQPIILSVETATMAGSISISRGGNILASGAGDPTTSHSNTLLADIDELFSTVNLKMREVDLFAVACGPGSFTGLRIGIATIKALATTMRRPCVGIPTLQAIAHSAGLSQATVALLPAGRGEVFAQMFSISVTGVVTELDQPAHLPPIKALERYMDRGDICWAGEGAQVYSNLIQETATKTGRDFVRPNTPSTVAPNQAWRIAPPALNLAQHVASLALSRVERDDVQTPESLRAIYVRPSDAEMKL